MMDKLKEHAYWISLGTIGLVLLLLVYFLVVARIYDLPGSSSTTVAALGKELEGNLKSIEAFNLREHVPTEQYMEHLEKKLDRVLQNRNDGVDEYNDARERFGEFFDGTNVPQDPGIFASTYHEKVEELIKNYREEFGIKTVVEDEDDRDKAPAEVPSVDRLEQGGIFDQNVPILMKEYWITEAIFDAMTRLKIGGLQTVRFHRLGRKDPDEENEHYSMIDVDLTIEMPFSKIEDLISRLFADDRVRFVFDGFEVTKSVAHLKPYMALKQIVEFENRDDADQAKYADVVPEPNVSVELTLKVLDWKGMALLQRSDLNPEDEDEYKDEYEDEDE